MPDIEIFSIDTGRLFLPRNLDDLIERVQQRYGRALRMYYPDTTDMEEWVGKELASTASCERPGSAPQRRWRSAKSRRSAVPSQPWRLNAASAGLASPLGRLDALYQNRTAEYGCIQDLPAARLVGKKSPGLHCKEIRFVLQHLARQRLSQYRLRALHSSGASRRRPPLRAVVVGTSRLPRITVCIPAACFPRAYSKT